MGAPSLHLDEEAGTPNYRTKCRGLFVSYTIARKNIQLQRIILDFSDTPHLQVDKAGTGISRNKAQGESSMGIKFHSYRRREETRELQLPMRSTGRAPGICTCGLWVSALVTRITRVQPMGIALFSAWPAQGPRPAAQLPFLLPTLPRAEAHTFLCRHDYLLYLTLRQAWVPRAASFL